MVARDEDKTRRSLETKANQFAADLLMPREWIRKDARYYDFDVTLLAKRYEKSEQAIWFRLLTLKLVNQSESEVF
jgi:Zn-dependent peptidase ImmA (M78 family)